MKEHQLQTIAYAVSLAIIGSIITTLLMRPSSEYAEPKAAQESTYERVIRTGVLRCGYLVWPPYFDIDPNSGELYGFYKDIIDQTLGLIDIDVEYVAEYNIGSQAQDLNSGKFDALCGDGPWNIHASKYVDYSTALDYFPVYAYVRGDDNQLNTLTDLNNEAFGIIAMDGDLSEELARRLFPKAKLSTLPSAAEPSQLLVSVTTKKADAVIVDVLLADAFLASNPGEIRQLSSTPVGLYPDGFSVRKGDVQLISTLNTAIEMASNLGIYKQIAEEHGVELGREIYSRAPKYLKSIDAE